MKFAKQKYEQGEAMTPTEIIAQALTVEDKNGVRGNGSQKKVQGLAKMTAEDNGVIITQAAPDDLPTSKLAADVLVSLENQPVVDQFTPVLDVNPGEIAIDKTDDEANGHKANADKEITPEDLETRIFFPKAIYKLTRLDHMTYLTQATVVKYAVDRASKKVADALAQAILVGGLKNEDGSDYDAVRPIVGDSLATAVTVENDPVKIAAAMTRDVEDVKGDKPVVFMASDVYKTVMAAALTNIALLQIMGKDSPYNIIPTKVLNGKAAYVVIDPKSYQLGFQSKGIETLTDFVITQNSQYLEARLYTAGTLALKGGAIVATVSATPASDAA